MPELPEVETISRVLREGGPVSPPLLGRVIVGSDLSWQRTLAYPPPEEFADRIMGQVIEDIGRRGKYLLLHLDTDTLLFHLRMSGDLVLESADEPPDVHHRLTLELDNGNRLAFNDTRKFGRVWLVSDPQDILGSLGPEPELCRQNYVIAPLTRSEPAPENTLAQPVLPVDVRCIDEVDSRIQSPVEDLVRSRLVSASPVHEGRLIGLSKGHRPQTEG